MKNKLLTSARQLALLTLIYFAFWGVLTHFYLAKEIYVVPFEKVVKVINIEAEAKMVSPLPKK